MFVPPLAGKINQSKLKSGLAVINANPKKEFIMPTGI